MDGPRACLEDEFDEAISLINSVFRADTDQDIRTDYPLVFNQSGLEYMRIIRVDGRIVAHVPVSPREVYIGDDRFTVAVISSTLSPRFLPEMAKRLPPGTALVDAPMSGAPARAEDGTLTFMVGGNNEVVLDLMILFKIMGNDVHHLGSTGMGMTCKVINNFVSVTGFAAVRKALMAADILGLQRQRLLKVMRSSSGSTWYGDNIDRISWAREGYDAANTIGILEKDMLSFLDAISGYEDIEVENLARSVLDVVRAVEPLE